MPIVQASGTARMALPRGLGIALFAVTTIEVALRVWWIRLGGRSVPCYKIQDLIQCTRLGLVRQEITTASYCLA